MSKQQEPIIIVGGGIGGMASALAMARKGISTLLLEQAAQFREAGAGIQFCPNTFKMLDYLGIKKPFLDIAILPEYLCYTDATNGFEYMRLPLGETMIQRFNQPFGSFHREDVLRTFVDECRKSNYIQLLTSAKVVAVSETSQGVIVETADGKPYTGAALIGCDGIWSVVHKNVHNNQPPRNSGQIIYRGVVHRDEMPQGLQFDNIMHFVQPLAHFVHYPIGTEGYINISAIFQTDHSPDPRNNTGSKEELFKGFSGASSKTMEILERVDTTRRWVLCDREPSKEWTRGKITLLGDAAHATLPYMTSGAGMAVEDAVVLAEAIVEFDYNYPLAFKEYQSRRYLRCAYVQYFSRLYGDVHHATSSVARELRNDLISKRSVEENLNWITYLYKGINYG